MPNRDRKIGWVSFARPLETMIDTIKEKMTDNIAIIYEGLYGPDGFNLLTKRQLKYFISRVGAHSEFQNILEQSAADGDAYRVLRTTTGRDGYVY